MLYGEQVSRLIRDEFIQVDKTVKEDSYLGEVCPQLLQIEVTFGRSWLNHIVHLTEKVDEENRLMVEVLQPMHLLLVKIVHLVRRDHSILVQVDHFEPIAKRP